MKKQNVETEMTELVDKMQQQLMILEKKIDILIAHSSQKTVEARPSPKPFQQQGNSNNNMQRSQGNNYAQRVLYKAVCADCKKECEVPFKPSGERPVYCKDCFSKRKSAVGPFKGSPDARPGIVAPVQAINIAKPQVVIKKKPAEKKKAVEKKKPAAKKQKTKAK